jgi:hypothetical protein
LLIYHSGQLSTQEEKDDIGRSDKQGGSYKKQGNMKNSLLQGEDYDHQE